MALIIAATLASTSPVPVWMMPLYSSKMAWQAAILSAMALSLLSKTNPMAGERRALSFWTRISST